MYLTKTKELINTYGSELINGSIDDDKLKSLMNMSSFPNSPGYPKLNEPISDKNHSQSEAVHDFVLSIAPSIEKMILHHLTARLINLMTSEGKNSFMRTTSLSKDFLAYEMTYYPHLAETFFKPLDHLEPDTNNGKKSDEMDACRRIAKECSTKEDIRNLKTIILQPIIDAFTKKNIEDFYPHAVFSKSEGRLHFFGVNGVKFLNLSEELKNLHGDYLKSQILLCFKKQLVKVKTKEELDDLVNNFKLTDEYQVLATGQGVATRFFARQTSSIKAFNDLVKAQNEELIQGHKNKLEAP